MTLEDDKKIRKHFEVFSISRQCFKKYLPIRTIINISDDDMRILANTLRQIISDSDDELEKTVKKFLKKYNVKT